MLTTEMRRRRYDQIQESFVMSRNSLLTSLGNGGEGDYLATSDQGAGMMDYPPTQDSP